MANHTTEELTPLVSVIVPAYNAEKYLRQTLESVRAQTLSSWECIVVDDGSRDATASIAQEFAALDARVRLVQQSNSGVSVARNTGFANDQSEAPFVAFLDADDLWEPEMLQTLVEALNAHPHMVAAHCNAFYINAEGARIDEDVLEGIGRKRYVFREGGITFSNASEPTTFANVVTICPLNTPGCVVMRRTAFAHAGGFSLELGTQADWDLWVRLARLSDLAFIDLPLLAYRRHDANMSADRAKAASEARKLRRSMVDAPDNTPEQRRLAIGSYRAFYWYLARLRYPSAWQYARKRQLKQAVQTLMLALANTAMAV